MDLQTCPVSMETESTRDLSSNACTFGFGLSALSNRPWPRLSFGTKLARTSGLRFPQARGIGPNQEHRSTA